VNAGAWVSVVVKALRY